ncbi:MAG: hypothetical protein Q8R00_01000 [Candidatus Nanoarchaeia archaeon]|nr:hypothetical protein [Candidatus Nanoarchaeia archaeon]
MRKKGDVWVGAVLYMALGVIAITVILAAGLPLIQKMKDRNTIAQTKELMQVLDETIRRVASEGPGSQRQLSPFVIKSGELYIDEKDAIGVGSNTISWKSKTGALIMEPGFDKKEGNLEIRLDLTNVEEEYDIRMRLDYREFLDANLVSDFGNPFTGEFSLLVKNTGKFDSNGLSTIDLIVS